jgi:hypothetical protein
MNETYWLSSNDVGEMWRFIGHRVSFRKRCLCEFAACRLRWHLVTDEASRRAIQDAEAELELHPEGNPNGTLSHDAVTALYRFDDVATSDDRDAEAALLRDIFGNPFRPVSFSPQWRTDTALALAHQMYESRDFGAMPILADALQDAGCDNEDILSHCRGDGPHVRGCWVVDLVLGKE